MWIFFCKTNIGFHERNKTLLVSSTDLGLDKSSFSDVRKRTFGHVPQRFWTANDAKFPHTDAQADLSHRWIHMSERTFSPVLALIVSVRLAGEQR